MTARQEPCEHTPEDQMAWWHVMLRANPHRMGQVLWTYSLLQDTRDADIILFQLQLRTLVKPHANYIRAIDLFPDLWPDAPEHPK